MKKIVFLTGSRSDYGKVKPLVLALQKETEFNTCVYVTGMHMFNEFGDTYKEVLKDNLKNTYIDYDIKYTLKMDLYLSNLIFDFSNYINREKPDLIVVQGDRVEALAGALCGVLNNIGVAHIEGGELSGTIDESIRHAISKLAHVHFVSNDKAKKRLIQLGELENRIYVIGSPDIDIMLATSLPSLDTVKKMYNIPFDKYAIVMYHPVTTELSILPKNINNLVSFIKNSKKNFIVIYPNNDNGSDIIINSYETLKDKENVLLFKSINFEMFLTLLRNSDFLIGNSSAGIRECGTYGVPAINIGTRQNGRVKNIDSPNIININNNLESLNDIVSNIDLYRKQSFSFGKGNSGEQFVEIIKSDEFWTFQLQKQFVDIQF